MAAFEPVPVAQLIKPADQAFRRGMAVVNLENYNDEADKYLQEAENFAHELDARMPARLGGSPRRVMPREPEDVARIESFGRRFAGWLEPLTGMHVGEMLRGRFVFYDMPGDETPEHSDTQIDAEHMMTLGVDVTGRGLLRTWAYVHDGPLGHSVRTPILLEPGAAIVQRTTSPIEHAAQSLDHDRIVGIWDFALAEA